MSDYNKHSPDAMFATILQRLEQQDEQAATHRADVQDKLDNVLDEIRLLATRTQSLENDRWYQRGIVAAICVAAVMVWEWIKSKWGK